MIHFLMKCSSDSSYGQSSVITLLGLNDPKKYLKLSKSKFQLQQLKKPKLFKIIHSSPQIMHTSNSYCS